MEENRPTKGLEALNFTSNGNGTCYVSGIGTCKDTDIVIPSVYNGMRVTSITFNGTIAQWNAISKGFDWKYNVPATEVICSDGIVSLN